MTVSVEFVTQTSTSAVGFQIVTVDSDVGILTEPLHQVACSVRRNCWGTTSCSRSIVSMLSLSRMVSISSSGTSRCDSCSRTARYFEGACALGKTGHSSVGGSRTVLYRSSAVAALSGSWAYSYSRDFPGTRTAPASSWTSLQVIPVRFSSEGSANTSAPRTPERERDR